MLPSDDVFWLSVELSNSSDVAAELDRQLRAIYALPSYQSWLGTLAEADPFVLPDFAETALLETLRLAREGRLLAKVNSVGGRLFLTDGLWADPGVRVFPFSDESATLVGFVQKRGLQGWADWTLDLATGCGVNALAFGERSLAFDINTRALAYAKVNRAINRVSGKDCVLVLNDIRDGIPAAFIPDRNGRVLILANMPFAPTPPSQVSTLATNGGESGAEVQISAYRALADLIRPVEDRLSFRAFLLGMTIGDRASNRWEIVEHAVSLFGEDRVRWHLLSDEQAIRIEGVRQLGNPVPIGIALSGMASCRLTTRDENARSAKAVDFNDLAQHHASRGNPDMAYGVVEISSFA